MLCQCLYYLIDCKRRINASTISNTLRHSSRSRPKVELGSQALYFKKKDCEKNFNKSFKQHYMKHYMNKWYLYLPYTTVYNKYLKIYRIDTINWVTRLYICIYQHYSYKMWFKRDLLVFWVLMHHICILFSQVLRSVYIMWVKFKLFKQSIEAFRQ